MLLDQLEALADAGEHAEAEHIDLQQPERVDIVLVPFDEGAVLHGGVADGHDLGQAARASARSRRHAARDGAGSRSARCVSSSTRESRGSIGIEAGLADMLLGSSEFAQCPRRCVASAPTFLGQADHLADFADRRAAAIGDDGGGDAGAVAAVAVVDILDHLLAPLMLEIDVDVGRFVPLRARRSARTEDRSRSGRPR